MKDKTRWLRLPEAHDYPAAESYLALIFDAETATKMIRRLKTVKVVKFKAKDIFRASALPLLGPSNVHVKRDHQKLAKGDRVSPLLLIRQPKAGRVIIADGYHRLCAVYALNEDAMIPCKIAQG